jgi:hypothetical protein
MGRVFPHKGAASLSAPSASVAATTPLAAPPPVPPLAAQPAPFLLDTNWAAAGEDRVDRDYAKEAIQSQIAGIERWALQNRTDARKDLAMFWLLKAPAIAVSALSAMFVHFNLGTVALVAGAIATICAVVDGVNPRGKLRNAHWRAFSELRSLENRVRNRWTIATLNNEYNLCKTAAGIIQEATAEQERIGTYLALAETMFTEQPKARNR